MADGNIDFGKWVVPQSWNEITLKQYQDICKYYSDKEKNFDVRDVIHILCDKTIDEVNTLPIEFTEKIMEKLMWLNEKPEVGEPTISLKINGETYSINIMETMKTGEYLAVDTVLRSDSRNFSAILAILCRKNGEIYDSTFEAEKVNDRVKMFENVPMMDAVRVIDFFLQRYIILKTPSLLSSRLKEGIDLMRKDIETSHTNGEIGRRTMKSAMKRLRKLEKTINGI